MCAVLHPADSFTTPLGKREQLIDDSSARGEHLAVDERVLDRHARSLGHVGRRRVCGISDEHDATFDTPVHGHLLDGGEVDGARVHNLTDERGPTARHTASRSISASSRPRLSRIR